MINLSTPAHCATIRWSSSRVCLICSEICLPYKFGRTSVVLLSVRWICSKSCLPHEFGRTSVVLLSVRRICSERCLPPKLGRTYVVLLSVRRIRTKGCLPPWFVVLLYFVRLLDLCVSLPSMPVLLCVCWTCASHFLYFSFFLHPVLRHSLHPASLFGGLSLHG